jgi:hypothetical protein
MLRSVISLQICIPMRTGNSRVQQLHLWQLTGRIANHTRIWFNSSWRSLWATGLVGGGLVLGDSRGNGDVEAEGLELA